MRYFYNIFAVIYDSYNNGGVDKKGMGEEGIRGFKGELQRRS